jgi:4-diphosphocytidyl-2-C-methyl-D-erythritol kinase
MSPSPLILRAPAKVNLTLEVLGRRADGYHDICSVVQAISLADELTFAPAPDVTLRCDEPDLQGPENLVWRAADLLRRSAGVRQGAAIALAKRIPVAAGLGGGSSDAAACLRGLNALWRVDLGVERLMDLAAHLGSDVPFFMLPRGCALAEGRGERLTPLPPLPRRWLVLVKPPIGISAAAAYGALDATEWSDGTHTRAWLAQAKSLGTVPAPFNGLEPAALRAAPEAAAARDTLLAADAPYAVMSGSGSTYFCLFESEQEAKAVRLRVQAPGHQPYLAHFLSPSTAPDLLAIQDSGVRS